MPVARADQLEFRCHTGLMPDPYTTPAWAVRIRNERLARGWSVRDAVRALIANALPDEKKSLPSEETLRRRWYEWEAGEHDPSGGQGFYAPIIARTLGTARYALFPKRADETDDQLMAATGMDTAEILARLQRSDVDAATLEALRHTVDRLCCDYPHQPSDSLIVEARQWLRRVVDLRGHRLTLSQHRDILVLAGWLALLTACVENDMGNRPAAETTRKMALSLGLETGDGEIIGWANELRAWFALTDGDYQGVMVACESGIEAAAHSGVAVQLLAQQAKAWARLGDRRQMEVALDRGRRLLDEQPYPENLDHHFKVDPSKFDFYAMDCYRIAGVNTLAQNYADEVVRASTDPFGVERKPMRIAEAHVTRGVIAAREGDLEGAVMHGNRALRGDRQSLPSLLMVSSELGRLISTTYGDEPAGREYLAQLRSLREEAKR